MSTAVTLVPIADRLNQAALLVEGLRTEIEAAEAAVERLGAGGLAVVADRLNDSALLVERLRNEIEAAEIASERPAIPLMLGGAIPAVAFRGVVTAL